MAKNKKVTAQKYITPEEIRWGTNVEYKMPSDLYNALVTECRKKKAGDIQNYLCHYVNEQCGLLGSCVRVTIA